MRRYLIFANYDDIYVHSICIQQLKFVFYVYRMETHIEYHPNGQKRFSIISYKLKSYMTSWYMSGKKEHETCVDINQRRRETQWYENGQICSEFEFIQTSVLRPAKMPPNFIGPVRNGKQTRWYENGQKRSEITYDYGIKEGEETLWYENGQKQREIHYVHGIKEGEEKRWNEAGEVIIDVGK
jgi:antitoxin component YwqK of YwqJK toxin-antitoxin module